MSDVLRAFGNALRSVLHPRMLALTIWPMLFALVLWVGLAWWHWDTWSQWLSAAVAGAGAEQWLPERVLAGLVRFSALLLLSTVLAPMILITAVLIAAVLQMPLIVDFVATREYPHLEKRHGGTVAGSIANALIAVSVFAGLWIVTLPLWLTGILAPVLPVLLSAYLNQRLFRYDALSEHAAAGEFQLVLETSWGRLYTLGLLLGLLYFVPLLNLLAPVLSGLAFTHFGLARLAQMRVEAGGVRREDRPSLLPSSASRS